MGYSDNKLSKDYIKRINEKVALLNSEIVVGTPGQIRDGVFEILKKYGKVIYYPFIEDNLWGIYSCKNDKNYFIINTAIELEKQVFAAAHELAHLEDIARIKFDIITAELLIEYVNNDKDGEKIAEVERIANRFAAELLVGKKNLSERYHELSPELNNTVKAILLSDAFLVPYRVIVKRLFEIEIIKVDELNKLLEVETINVKKIAERYECCIDNFQITNKKILGGYVDYALRLYENELSTYIDISNLLKLVGKLPEDYGIFDDSLDDN